MACTSVTGNVWVYVSELHCWLYHCVCREGEEGCMVVEWFVSWAHPVGPEFKVQN